MKALLESNKKLQADVGQVRDELRAVKDELANQKAHCAPSFFLFSSFSLSILP